MGILASTNHLVHLFRHYCGQTEVPESYYDWSLLSAISAVMQDRVWVEKFSGDHLTPNLYTFLIGPSGIGKGTAIKRVLPFLDALDLPMHVGPITGAALNALLVGKKGAVNGKIYLVQEELAYCLGHGDMAFDFIKTLTGIYSPTKKMQKATVTRGFATMKNISINWIAGTTVEWLVKTIPKEAVKGGFVGRVFPVYANHNYEKRIPRPIYPDDIEEVREHLAMRFQQLALVEGPFTVSKKAQRILDHWYMTRPAPANDDLASVWQRQHDMIYKIAMLFSLCEDYTKRIKSHHIAQAIEDVTKAEESSKVIIRAAEANEDSDVTDIVRVLVARARIIPESALMRECNHRGISKRAMMSALDALLTERAITIQYRKMITGGRITWYAWHKGLVNHLTAIK